jgi:hypothetical protein
MTADSQCACKHLFNRRQRIYQNRLGNHWSRSGNEKFSIRRHQSLLPDGRGNHSCAGNAGNAALATRSEKVFFYGAGCADEKSSRPVTNALSHCLPCDTIEVASDMLGAARGLCGHTPGLACILGTGANNAFYDGSHIVRSIGSLGFWLGDEGSGSYLGKTLVVHYLQNELPQDLHAVLLKNIPEINRLMYWIMPIKSPTQTGISQHSHNLLPKI